MVRAARIRDAPAPRRRRAFPRRCPVRDPARRPPGGLRAESYGAIRTGEAIEGLPVFADGLRAARITEAVLASARAQAWVEMDDAASGRGAADGDAIVEVGG